MWGMVYYTEIHLQMQFGAHVIFMMCCKEIMILLQVPHIPHCYINTIIGTGFVQEES